MAKAKEVFEAEHEAFRERLRSIHAGPVGIAARDAMLALRAEYKAAAIAHWAELGNRASTGWGETPEGEYQSSRSRGRCADSLANTLAHYFSQDPADPPGSTKEEVS